MNDIRLATITTCMLLRILDSKIVTGMDGVK
jgi:hypothetical protein